MSALHDNLRNLLAIRVIILLCQFVALAYGRWGLQLDLPYLAILSIMGSFIAISIGVVWRLQLAFPVTEKEFLIHLLMGVIVLSLLMYLTGGATNPFISYLLVPIMISAATLSGAYTWGLTLISLAAYTLLLFHYHPLPDLMPITSDGGHSQAIGFNLHILGMWFNFLVSAGLITLFVVKMARALRQQQKQLATLREATLRDEQIMAIATQAAGTAHELGTPLSTMTIMLKDMTEEESDPTRRREFQTLLSQLALCRDSLRQLVSKSDPLAEKHASISLAAFIDHLLDRWQLLKPEAAMQVKRTKQEAQIMLQETEGLQQAIINLLNNAAEVSEEAVHIEMLVSDNQWALEITDRGPGITNALRQQLGSSLYSSKESGLGMGFLLSHATIERLGGRVHLDPAPTGGTLTRIEFPRRQANEQ